MNKSLLVFLVLLLAFISFRSEAGRYAETPQRNAYPNYYSYPYPGHNWNSRVPMCRYTYPDPNSYFCRQVWNPYAYAWVPSCYYTNFITVWEPCRRRW